MELDPDFADAWAWLGLTRSFQDQFPKARQAAQRALELDERLGLAHAVLGRVRRQYDWDFSGARRAFERAVHVSPSDPFALWGYGWYLLLIEGRTEEALRLSARLSLVAPFNLGWRAERGSFFFFVRQYERALEEYERVKEMDPEFQHLGIGDSYVMLGRFEDAQHAYIAFLQSCGAPCDWAREAMERGWTEGGWEGSVRALLEAATGREGLSPSWVASRYALIGETDEAWAWLERGYRERDPLMTELRLDPVFDPLRSDPRFDDLLRRIGFPDE